jgi:hypothetical protein
MPSRRVTVTIQLILSIFGFIIIIIIMFFKVEFRQYFDHLDTLGFEDEPDYEYLKDLFKNIFIAREYSYDEVLFDWEIRLNQHQYNSQQFAR